MVDLDAIFVIGEECVPESIWSKDSDINCDMNLLAMHAADCHQSYTVHVYVYMHVVEVSKKVIS